jgi:hypothetical protein
MTRSTRITLAGGALLFLAGLAFIFVTGMEAQSKPVAPPSIASTTSTVAAPPLTPAEFAEIGPHWLKLQDYQIKMQQLQGEIQAEQQALAPAMDRLRRDHGIPATCSLNYDKAWVIVNGTPCMVAASTVEKKGKDKENK